MQARRGYLRRLHIVGVVSLLVLLGMMGGFDVRRFITSTSPSKLILNLVILLGLPRRGLLSGRPTMKAGKFSSNSLLRMRGLATGVPGKLQTRNWPRTFLRKGIFFTAPEMRFGEILMGCGISWTVLVSLWPHPHS